MIDNLLRSAIASPGELAVLDEMRVEHAQLDPQLEHIDAQYERSRWTHPIRPSFGILTSGEG